MKLDHIVYFSRSTPEKIVSRERKKGMPAVEGGSHLMWGTYNALLYTQNGYIEWLMVENISIARQSDQLLTRLLLHDLEFRTGWGTLCFSVSDIAEFRQNLAEKGFQVPDVISAQRVTPNGTIRKWKMLFVEHRISRALPFPFFIEWEESEEIRLRKLQDEGLYTSGNREIKITECIFEVSDPVHALQVWSNLLPASLSGDRQLRIGDVKLTFRKKGQLGAERLQSVRLKIKNRDFQI